MKFDFLIIFILESLAAASLFLNKNQVLLFLTFHFISVLYFVFRYGIKSVPLILYSFFLPYSSLLFLFKNKKINFKEDIENIDSKKLFLLENIKPIKRSFGESTIHSLVNNQKAPSELRLRAFIILTELINPNTISLLKMGLSDQNDEIRLLCYSVLNTVEKKIQNEIHETTVSGLPEEEKHKKLAKLNWELIYLNLVDKEFKTLILKEIYEQVDHVLKHSKDEELLKFKAKIFIYEKKYEEAYGIYRHFPDDKEIIPYLLEIFYYKKEFKKLKEYIKKYPHIRYYDKFYNIYRFWNG